MTNTTEPPKLNILLYGLGAIGSFYAFILQRSPRVRLSVAARSNFDAVKENGILIRSENHGEHRFRPYAVYDSCDAIRRAVQREGEYDFVVVASKAVDLRGTVRDLVGVVGTGTTVVVMQNGVGNEEYFLEVFPGRTILSGVIWVGATQDSPGVVRQHISENTTIGIFDNPDIPSSEQETSLEKFTSLLREGGTPFVVEESIQTSRWKKCIWNAAWNSLATLSGIDVHAWLDSSSYAMETTRRLILEAINVANAIGVPGIDDSLVDELIGRMQGFNQVVWTSMYHDSRAKRAMEIDVILGNIVKKGKEKGVPVPTLETLYALLVAMEVGIEREKEEEKSVEKP